MRQTYSATVPLFQYGMVILNFPFSFRHFVIAWFRNADHSNDVTAVTN